jgi:hypothetical protein
VWGGGGEGGGEHWRVCLLRQAALWWQLTITVLRPPSVICLLAGGPPDASNRHIAVRAPHATHQPPQRHTTHATHLQLLVGACQRHLVLCLVEQLVELQRLRQPAQRGRGLVEVAQRLCVSCVSQVVGAGVACTGWWGGRLRRGGAAAVRVPQPPWASTCATASCGCSRGGDKAGTHHSQGGTGFAG